MKIPLVALLLFLICSCSEEPVTDPSREPIAVPDEKARAQMMEAEAERELLQHRAELGDAAAQFQLGKCYALGKGIGRSDEEAAKWYREAAAQGHVEAQAVLGLCYHNGFLKLNKDRKEALKWLLRAAKKGNATAQSMLGNIYQHGEGVPHDSKISIEWFRKAAEQGEPLAQLNVAYSYFSMSRMAVDQGVARFGEGRTWFKPGPNNHDEEAVKWFQKAADQGLASAQHGLAVCFHLGRGVAQSNTSAHVWYLLAHENGYQQSASSIKRLEEWELTRGQIAEGRKQARKLVNEIRERKESGGRGDKID